MSEIAGVVFDFNGTLFWDTKLHNEAWDVYLKSEGMELSDQEKNKKIHGKTNKDILNSLHGKELTGEEIKRHSLIKENIYQELCLKSEMELAPGAIEFLDYLTKKKIKFTIATASDYYNVDFYFEKFKLQKFFEREKIVHSDGKIASKPDPEIFEKAINNIGIERGKVLIFEDSISGIKAAENAGAGKIIIVNSNDEDYSRWNYQKIKSFNEVDKKIFE